MIRILVTGFFAASFLGAILFVFGATTTEARSTPVTAKSDRLDARPYGAACSEATWPYYEAGCLRNTTTPTRRVAPVRVVTTDRVR